MNASHDRITHQAGGGGRREGYVPVRLAGGRFPRRGFGHPAHAGVGGRAAVVVVLRLGRRVCVRRVLGRVSVLLLRLLDLGDQLDQLLLTGLGLRRQPRVLQ
jgi:hypothetical protein